MNFALTYKLDLDITKMYLHTMNEVKAFEGYSTNKLDRRTRINVTKCITTGAFAVCGVVKMTPKWDICRLYPKQLQTVCLSGAQTLHGAINFTQQSSTLTK